MDPLIEKLGVRETIIENIAADSAEPHQIGTGIGVQEEICASGHLVLTQVENNELLPIEFVSTLHPRSNDWMTLRRVAANDENKVSLFHIGNGTRIAAIAYGAEQTLGRRRLAIAGAIVNIVGPDDGARQLLH